MRVIERIWKAAGPSQPGPLPTFSHVHVVRAIFKIAENPGMGRKRLGEALGLGEGVTRTLLSRLKSEDIVETGRAGCFLTEAAQSLHRELINKMSHPSPINIKNTWPYECSVAVKVIGAANLVRRGLEQRDAAVRAGAGGAITLTYRAGRLLMPGISDVSSERPDFAEKIIREVGPSDGDVIIIAGADNPHDAENGAIAAALATISLQQV